MSLKKIFSLFLLSLFSLFSIFPIYSILSASWRSQDSFHSTTFVLWGADSSWKNYFDLFLKTDFLVWVQNSVVVSTSVTILGVGLATFAGYALSRFHMKGKKSALLFLMMTQMFPCTMLLLPFYIVLTKLKLMNSFLGLILVYSATALPFCIWQMKGFFDTIPKELEEAARMDGCSNWKVFNLVILPISLPALVITSLFSFLTAWCEYAIAAIVLQDPALYTLPIGLKTFQSSLSTQWGLYSAGAVVVSIPVVALFMYLTRYLISGLTLGSVKG